MKKASIPNTKLEEWFTDVTIAEQQDTYLELADEKKLVHTASARATHVVDKTFKYLIAHFEAVEGVPVRMIQYELYPELRKK